MTAGYVYLSAAILAEVIATTSLTASEGFSRIGPSVLTVIGYATAIYCLSLTLASVPTGIAYAIWSGIGIILIALLAWLVRGQALDLAAVIGMALIIAGVLVINLFSQM